MQHDRYDNDILKALRDISKSLNAINTSLNKIISVENIKEDIKPSTLKRCETCRYADNVSPYYCKEIIGCKGAEDGYSKWEAKEND